MGVQLKGDNRTQILVKYQVIAISASEGNDFEGISEGKLFFKPGETLGFIPIKFFGDVIKETDEKLDIRDKSGV